MHKKIHAASVTKTIREAARMNDNINRFAVRTYQASPTQAQVFPSFYHDNTTQDKKDFCSLLALALTSGGYEVQIQTYDEEIDPWLFVTACPCAIVSLICHEI